MDVELKEIINCFDLNPEFFISNKSLKKLWTKCFNKEKYSGNYGLFMQAFENIIGKEIINSI